VKYFLCPARRERSVSETGAKNPGAILTAFGTMIYPSVVNPSRRRLNPAKTSRAAHLGSIFRSGPNSSPGA
jgi:hypothetical protein